MRLSTKGRYGLRAMVDLAAHSNKDHVSLLSIAERQEISGNYLEQVFSTLRKAGLVRSVKGAQGGYCLAVDPAELKIGTILRTLEGDLSMTEGDDAARDNSIQRCIRINVWNRIDEKVNELVDSMTLKDLADEYRDSSRSAALLYDI